jgi:hypothetical protein
MKFRDSSVAVATAADEAFKGFLSEWIGCMLRHNVREYAHLVVFDCGLSSSTRKAIHSYGVEVFDAPEHRIRVDELPGYFAAQTLRPSLPSLLPKSDFVIWVDSDCWLQDGRAIRDLLEVAHSSELACCAELDRGYKTFSQSSVHSTTPFDQEVGVPVYVYWSQFFMRFFSEEVSRKLAAYPHLNAGVFCAHRKSPVWQVWSNMLDRCLGILADRKLGTDFLGRRLDLIVDQTALNAAVRTGNIGVNYLPSTYNWVCHRALPLFDEVRERFTEQCWPYDAIKILHLATPEIKAVDGFQISTLNAGRIGEKKMMSLRCPDRVLL